MLLSLSVIQIVFSVCALVTAGSGPIADQGYAQYQGALNTTPNITSGPIVDLGYAQYQGALNTILNITSFLGIRYAAAPVIKTHSVLYIQLS